MASEVLISDMRSARSALSKLLRWFRVLHLTSQADKGATSSAAEEDALKSKLKSHNQREIVTLLESTPLDNSPMPCSQTEALLNLNVTSVLAHPGVHDTKASHDAGKRVLPDYPTAQDIAHRLRVVVENEKQMTEDPGMNPSLQPEDHQSHPSDCRDSLHKDESVILHTRIEAVRAAMDAIFSRTRQVLTATIAKHSSIQFPKEALDDAKLAGRCCFTAHIPNPRRTAQLSVQDAHDCLRDVSVLIKATDSILWLSRSNNHDTTHACLGLKAPDDALITQARFYASQQGSYSRNHNYITVLVKRNSGHDEIWLVGNAEIMEAHGARLTQTKRELAFAYEDIMDWSNNIYQDTPLRNIQSCDIKVIPLARARSRALFVSGCRGIACVLAEPSFLTIYDLEDVVTDDDDDS
jgi:hypothetical protein